MTVTAHSGAYNTPDNTIENVKKVIEKNCEIFEVDVTFRPSGTPVIIHSGNPSENEGVLLEDVFALVAKSNSKAKMNLDIKSTLNLPAVDELLKKYGLIDRAFYTGVFTDWVDKVKANSCVPYYLNDSIKKSKRKDAETLNALADKVTKLGAIGLNTNYKNATPLMMKIFHERNIPVSVWTINGRIRAKKYIKMGADNITTKKPQIFKK